MITLLCILAVAVAIGGGLSLAPLNLLTRVTDWLNGTTAQSAPQGQSLSIRCDGPRNAVIVMDVSPSMLSDDWDPTRLAGGQQAAKRFVSRLAADEPAARVAIVTYSRSAEIVCDLTSVQDSATIFKLIDAIQTGSATNLTAGLIEADRLLRRAGPSVRQVIAVTDGAHNHGRYPYTAAKQLRESAVLEIVGIGGSPADVNETLLKDLASSYADGRKRYRWIGDPEELERHFDNLAGRITRS